MVSQNKIDGLLKKYNNSSTPEGERTAIRQKLEDLGVLKPQSNALIPTKQTSNAVVPYQDPVLTPPSGSGALSTISNVVSVGKQLAELNAAWGNPVGRFGRWIGKKLKKGAKKLVDKFSKKKETKVPAIEAPPADDVVDPVVQQEKNIISSSTVYPQMYPSSLYKPAKSYAARAYESMLPRRRYRNGMFGHSTYNNMGFFSSFVSPSNRRFY